jgi:hypothetical protein
LIAHGFDEIGIIPSMPRSRTKKMNFFAQYYRDIRDSQAVVTTRAPTR